MKEDLMKDRAYIEINLDNLEHNIYEIKKIIHKKTRIMAVVKANAYGHGLVNISKRLNEIGIYDFAVATLQEGITLRENNIIGNILILGFTSIENLKYVIDYDLIQTIIDYNYSEKVKTLNLRDKLKCHIKINTGMNRIGEKFDNIEKLSKIYENGSLNILGIFSHLCVSDSSNISDIEFTRLQIKNFNECLIKLKSRGYNIGVSHLQSSYGVINYSDLCYDYVRIGIFMYGVNSSSDSYNLNKINLKPVLKLKAKVTSIKLIYKGDSVGYGRTYISNKIKRVATLSIGYADGYPRNLSNKAVVKINNKYAPIIGRICMDQLVIDVSDIRNIQIGAVATLIGADKEISIEEISKRAKTISNELLSTLGSRLNRITMEEFESLKQNVL